MKCVQINARSYDWANSIMLARHCELMQPGHESWVFWA